MFTSVNTMKDVEVSMTLNVVYTGASCLIRKKAKGKILRIKWIVDQNIQINTWDIYMYIIVISIGLQIVQEFRLSILSTSTFSTCGLSGTHLYSFPECLNMWTSVVWVRRPHSALFNSFSGCFLEKSVYRWVPLNPNKQYQVQVGPLNPNKPSTGGSRLIRTNKTK